MNTTTTDSQNIYDWLHDQAQARGLAGVRPQPQKRDAPEEMDKRRTRYGVLPTWSHPCQARDYYVWTLPANTIFPFRYFKSEIGQDYKGNILYETFRDTPTQIEDIRRNIPFFIELPELFEFDEDEADRIAQVIHLPRKCVKFPTELGTSCTTCWLAYLEHDVVDRIENELEGEARTAAYSVARKIINGLESALDECRKLMDTALRDVDDPNTGKSKLNDFDLRNVYHLHQDRPEYKTSINRETNLATTITDAFAKLAQVLERQQPATTEDTATLKAQLAEMQKKLEAVEQAERKTVSIEVVEKEPTPHDPVADKMARVRAAKKANEDKAVD